MVRPASSRFTLNIKDGITERVRRNNCHIHWNVSGGVRCYSCYPL